MNGIQDPMMSESVQDVNPVDGIQKDQLLKELNEFQTEWRRKIQNRQRKERAEMFPEREKERKLLYRKNNPEKVRETKRKYMKKYYAENSAHKMRAIISARLNELIGGKNWKRSQEILGYTSDELRAHIESLWEEGMTWDNYGLNGWHVDHIVPLAHFGITSVDDPNMKVAWALNNLRPLWAEENLKKRDHVTHETVDKLIELVRES